MCGFAGFWSDGPPDEGVAARMAAAIAHRGPDDSGTWTDSETGIALAHRRLAVLDLSPAGHQPMSSSGSRYILVFNGEIYNHLDLRGELEEGCRAISWRGHSDTETLLAAILYWGLEEALAKSVGMFALALWDREKRILHLARDRFGEKPLYYGWSGCAFLFGSELKALRAWPRFSNAVSRRALQQYFRFMYIPSPSSIYEGVYKLEPGCLLSIAKAPPRAPPASPLEVGTSYGSMRLTRWYSLKDNVTASARSEFRNESEALTAVEESLRQSVKRQSFADVPVGAFLSGGIDSSTITALLQQQSARPVKTFTVGFEDAGFDESEHARRVAEHLGTDHTEIFVSASEARSLIPMLPRLYDEPFADSSQIPTHLICRVARQQVTVALSGDGGDEFFGGYNRYFWAPRIWDRIKWLPFFLRRGLGGALSIGSTGGWDALGRWVSRFAPQSEASARLGEKILKLSRCMRESEDLDSIYLSLVTEWPEPGALVRTADHSFRKADAVCWGMLPSAGADSGAARMMYQDCMTYLPDDILCKVDRAAMATSLETRAPFLDKSVVDSALRLPMNLKIRENKGKWALRQVLYKYVPRELIDRPKAGFGIPIGEWLRGPLRDWAEALLNTARIDDEGYLSAKLVQEVWRQHLSGRWDWTARLWSILMFQAWLEDQRRD